MSSTRVQLLQNGNLHSIDLPGARSPRETERLQEYIQNTAFGTKNLLKSMSKDSIDFLCSYYSWSDKTVGGVFDGLSRGEAQWLREQGCAEDRQWYDPELFENEMQFLCEQSVFKAKFTSPVVAPVQAPAQPVVSQQAHSADLTINNEAILRNPAPGVYVVKRGTISALKTSRNHTTAVPPAATVPSRVGAVGDGRPACYSAQETASLSTSRTVHPPTCPSSSSSAWSMERLPSRSTSPPAQLVGSSAPDNSNTVAASARSRPTRHRIPLTATIRHERAHGRFCPYRCEYDSNTNTWVIQQRLPQILTVDSCAVPEEVPETVSDEVPETALEEVPEEVPEIDWAREGRRWRFSRGGQRGDPAMDCLEW